MILFMFGRIPRVLWEGISGSVEFTYFRKTPCNSRGNLASPAILCDHAMVLVGGRLAAGRAEEEPSAGFC